MSALDAELEAVDRCRAALVEAQRARAGLLSDY
jgi:hypothetical protein